MGNPNFHKPLPLPVELMPYAPEAFYRHLILSLIQALEHHKSLTSCHALNVTVFSMHLARHLRPATACLTSLFWGSLLHDIGKIAVPQHILRKAGPLTAEEWQIVRTHPTVGFQMLEGVGLTREALNVVLFHHERWDGNGYPLGLAGNVIPLEARICALADAFEAMTSDRPYRRALTYDEACAQVRQGTGTQFDPALVEAFLSIDPHDWVLLRSQTAHRSVCHTGGGGGNADHLAGK